MSNGQSNSSYSYIASDLRNSAETISIFIYVPNSDFTIGFINRNSFEKIDLPKCIGIDSNKETSLKVIDVLFKNNLLNQTYFPDLNSEDFVNNKTKEIVKWTDIKLYLDIDFETPGHYEKIFIPISDFQTAENLIDELVLVFADSKKCFEKLKGKIKT